MKKIFILSILFVLFCGNGESFRLEAQDSTLKYVGDIIKVDYFGELIGTSIIGFGCTVKYDSNIIQFDSSEVFSLFDQENISLIKGKDNNPVKGTLLVAFTMQSGYTKPVFADTTFKLFFTALAKGETILHIEDAKCNKSISEEISFNYNEPLLKVEEVIVEGFDLKVIIR